MTELKDVVTFIGTTDQTTLDIIYQAMRARTKTLRDESTINALTSLKAQDRVVIGNVSPKYLSGLRGTIISIDPSSKWPFKVELDMNTRRGKVINFACSQVTAI